AGPRGLAVGEIGSEIGTSPATLSFHLKELSLAGLITPQPAGRFIYYAANFAQMNALIAFLTDNCCARDGACCVPRSLATPRSRTLKSTR
ncbi:MAG: ArsR/SmtB family transcription factor, partial [Gammaproteobacteria bacterium]